MQKRHATIQLRWCALLALSAVPLLFTGCASSKSKEAEIHQRGWIGGVYRSVGTPPALKETQKKAFLLTALAPNTPARLAGLQEGDLILELNHQPVTKPRKFRRIIDHSEPGTMLPVKVWRDGQLKESQVCVGRETFERVGTFAAGFFFTQALDLWPDPAFSLIVLGYDHANPLHRHELGSPEQAYYRSLNKEHSVVDRDWWAWLVIFRAEVSKSIKSQEVVAAK